MLFRSILPLGVVFGVLFPLQDARKTALSERTQAVALNLWVQDRVRDVKALNPMPERGTRQAVGTSEIEQDLISAGLRDAVRELSSDSDGVVELRFENVHFTRLADWLTGLDPAWGYDVSLFRFEATETTGNVAATLTLAPQASDAF